MITKLDEIIINPEKVKNIRKLVYVREVQNIKTQKLKDSEIKENIKKVLEREVDKCY